MEHTDMIVYDKGLPDTQGWAKLSPARQKWLQEKTSNIKKFGAMEALSYLAVGLELLDVRNGLKNEELGITEYIRTVFGGNSEVTGFRRMEDAEEITKYWPAEFSKKVAERAALLQGSAGVRFKELIMAAKELPATRERDDKTIDAFVENKLRPKLKEHRQIRRAGKTVKLNDHDGKKQMYNNWRRVLKAMKGLKLSADYAAVIEEVGGWLLNDFAIRGPVTIKRVAAPKGMIAKVGFPEGQKRVKKVR